MLISFPHVSPVWTTKLHFIAQIWIIPGDQVLVNGYVEGSLFSFSEHKILGYVPYINTFFYTVLMNRIKIFIHVCIFQKKKKKDVSCVWSFFVNLFNKKGKLEGKTFPKSLKRWYHGFWKAASLRSSLSNLEAVIGSMGHCDQRQRIKSLPSRSPPLLCRLGQGVSGTLL